MVLTASVWRHVLAHLHCRFVFGAPVFLCIEHQWLETAAGCSHQICRGIWLFLVWPPHCPRLRFLRSVGALTHSLLISLFTPSHPHFPRTASSFGFYFGIALGTSLPHIVFVEHWLDTVGDCGVCSGPFDVGSPPTYFVLGSVGGFFPSFSHLHHIGVTIWDPTLIWFGGRIFFYFRFLPHSYSFFPRKGGSVRNWVYLHRFVLYVSVYLMYSLRMI
ncbi:hypothetical protein FB45DRAFT_340691 [Roridomyces roridus]|uniref:Uncharacterized protein n=1 Tax=Roridomyces roridus TaxID=1738132 RepID=A0AAD7FC08_9AGAR|nr:hypothetical protein FB45DRAFT_340691 [Roridomyces roridus]